MQVTCVYMYESAIGQSYMYMIETKITSITRIKILPFCSTKGHACGQSEKLDSYVLEQYMALDVVNPNGWS